MTGRGSHRDAIREFMVVLVVDVVVVVVVQWSQWYARPIAGEAVSEV